MVAASLPCLAELAVHAHADSTNRQWHYRLQAVRVALCCCCCSDNSDLEAVLKETERQRREFAARYAFMTLDTDGDGYVSVEQVSVTAVLLFRPQELVFGTCTYADCGGLY